MIKGYITNLGKYNEGFLIGKWIDFPITEEELEKVYEEIGINEEYEEIFFTDWETEIGLDLGEYESIEAINELAEELGRLDTYDIEKLEAIMEANGDSVTEALNQLDDAVYYPGYNMVEVAEEIVNEYYGFKNVDDILFRYFDYESFARDLRFDGYTETSTGVIYTC